MHYDFYSDAQSGGNHEAAQQPDYEARLRDAGVRKAEAEAKKAEAEAERARKNVGTDNKKLYADYIKAAATVVTVLIAAHKYWKDTKS